MMATITFVKYKKQSAGTMVRTTKYVSQFQKTTQEDGCQLISGQNCTPQLAAQEFLTTRQMHHKDSPVWFYHYVQSFSPNEKISGALAHELACEFAEQAWPDSEILIATHTDADHILVTSGSQQGLDFSARVFLNPGDVVLLESPSYLGAVNAFKACEPRFIEVPTDNGGMIMEELEKILATTERVKMIYVIPDFQNPTGRTWDLERRHQFMEIVNRYEIPVIEDNPYGELRFEGEYLPALKSLDTKGLVIYLGTFSKILAPGYRIGWVCAEEHILAKYNFMEQAASLQASTIGQMETSKWIDMFDLDAHVATIRACYDKRRKVMLETLERELPEGCTFTHPVGGLFAWVVLPEYMDAKELQMKCLEKKVAFVPGGSFFPNGNHENTLRLNYSCMPEEKIVQGITALCQTIRENLR